MLMMIFTKPNKQRQHRPAGWTASPPLLWALCVQKRGLMLNILTIVICIWVIFFNGAEKLENTILGYFEFGLLADKAQYIKMLAWLMLVLSIVFFVSGLI